MGVFPKKPTCHHQALTRVRPVLLASFALMERDVGRDFLLPGPCSPSLGVRSGSSTCENGLVRVVTFSPEGRASTLWGHSNGLGVFTARPDVYFIQTDGWYQVPARRNSSFWGIRPRAGPSRARTGRGWELLVA